jgi:hypothetical protein
MNFIQNIQNMPIAPKQAVEVAYNVYEINPRMTGVHESEI